MIPTPGHTGGATAYLWDSGQHRMLFTGDTISGQRRVVRSGARHQRPPRYMESLELIRELDFDVLVPWAATAGRPLLRDHRPRGLAPPYRRDPGAHAS